MRLAVLDIGSNSVHLLVVDAHVGAPPLPATSHKEVLRLAEYLNDDGSIDADGQERLRSFIADAVEIAEDQGAEQILAFATSAVREAPNGVSLIESINAQLGVTLNVMTGRDEARVTFLAARRWFGWSAGKILLLDIGGGSLEIAAGQDEYPQAAVSVPLGAGRTYSDFLPDPVPTAEDIHRLRKHARAQIGRIAGDINRVGVPDQVVGSSKTFRSLARIAGAAPSGTESMRLGSSSAAISTASSTPSPLGPQRNARPCPASPKPVPVRCWPGRSSPRRPSRSSTSVS